MEELLMPVLFVVTILAGVLLFTPYEPFLEGVLALAIVLAAVVGFLTHPRREVFYVRTAVRLIDPDSARSFSIHRAPVGWVGRVSYLFMGEHGEYYGE